MQSNRHDAMMRAAQHHPDRDTNGPQNQAQIIGLWQTAERYGTAGSRSRLSGMNNFFSTADDAPDFPVDSPAGLDAGTEMLAPASPDVVDAPSDQPGSDTYWAISRTPLTSLVFSLPLVLAYEGGVLLLGHGSPRNGADVWLRQLLDLLGFGAYFLLPILTVVGLLAWHHVAHDRWRFSAAVLAGMAAESLLWAFLLIGVARLQESLWPLAVDQSSHGPMLGLVARFVGFCGAGLYEEVLFRLLLLPAVIWLLERWGQTRLSAALWGVVLTSVVFSGAHYVGPLGDVFSLYSFTFRTLAGLFFSLVFLARGFGIVAGAHAAYDLLVGLA
jgi:membrane protease YdiL (CAAX protease family)